MKVMSKSMHETYTVKFATAAATCHRALLTFELVKHRDQMFLGLLHLHTTQ